MLLLGTQGIGTDLNLNESFRFMDLALDLGISSFDTAERYPFPESDEKFGLTETIIGKWLYKFYKKRSAIKIGTKVTGRNSGEFTSISSERLDAKRIILSAENSLKRLKTDYLDIFYLHWPDRYTNNFGRKFYNPDPDPKFIPFEHQIDALNSLKNSGKILEYGLCNETPWGLMRICEIGRNNFSPSTVQDEYSIINRNIEKSIKEIIIREKLNFYAYSPLSGGLLTGKYHLDDNNFKSNKKEIRGRLDKYPKKTYRHNTKIRFQKVKILLDYCNQQQIKLPALALSFLKHQDFVKGAILGASSDKQLIELVSYWDTPLPLEIVELVVKKIFSDENHIY